MKRLNLFLKPITGKMRVSTQQTTRKAADTLYPYFHILATSMIQGVKITALDTVPISFNKSVHADLVPSTNQSQSIGVHRWICSLCKGINGSNLTKCKNCRAVRSSSSGYGLYVCTSGDCSTINDRYYQTECSSCGSLSKGTNDWLCLKCITANTRKALSCRECKTSQPIMWTCSNCSCEINSIFEMQECRVCKKPSDAVVKFATRDIPSCRSALVVCPNCDEPNVPSSIRCCLCFAGLLGAHAKKSVGCSVGLTAGNLRGDSNGTTLVKDIAVRHVVSSEVSPSPVSVTSPSPSPVSVTSDLSVHESLSESSDIVHFPPNISANDMSDKLKELPSLPISVKRWECRSCKSSNVLSSACCHHCGTKRQNYLWKSIPQKYWHCKTCDIDVSIFISQCSQCGSAREKIYANCTLCNSPRETLGQPCTSCDVIVQFAITCQSCHRLTTFNKHSRKCIWCGEESSVNIGMHQCMCENITKYQVCEVCIRYAQGHCWVCNQASCNNINSVMCRVCAFCGEGTQSAAAMTIPHNWQCIYCKKSSSAKLSMCTTKGCRGLRTFGEFQVKCPHCAKMTRWNQHPKCEQCSMYIGPFFLLDKSDFLSVPMSKRKSIYFTRYLVRGSSSHDDDVLSAFEQEDTATVHDASQRKACHIDGPTVIPKTSDRKISKRRKLTKMKAGKHPHQSITAMPRGRQCDLCETIVPEELRTCTNCGMDHE